MKKIYVFLLFLCVTATAHAQASCSQIVSLAPSLTEIVYALGLGDHLAGVTRYCRYPPDAREKPKVGGFLDPNFEAILLLKPDIILLLSEHQDKLAYFKKLGLAALTVEHRNIPGILNSIDTIAKHCGKTDVATTLVAKINERIDLVRKRVKDLPRIRTMLTIGGGEGGVFKNVFISGNDGFYSEMINIAGGINVYEGGTVTLPGLSAEGVLKLNPEVIIEITADADGKRAEKEAILKSWQVLHDVRAVQNGRVHILDEDFMAIPGPRFVDIVEILAKIIHPEAFVKETHVPPA